jgi:hypothetical protein
MEEFIGRKLTPGEIIHHINGDKKDNRLENLELMTIQEHTHLHHIGVPKPRSSGWHQKGKWKTCICQECGEGFVTYISRAGIYCSRECSGKNTLIKKGQRLSPETEFK